MRSPESAKHRVATPGGLPEVGQLRGRLSLAAEERKGDWSGMESEPEPSTSHVLCPCCSEPLQAASVEDARPGDMWCPTCAWLLLRELLAGNIEPAVCPSHGRAMAPSEQG